MSQSMFGRLIGGLFAFAICASALANDFAHLTVTPASSTRAATTTYTVEMGSGSNGNITNARLVVDFPAGYVISSSNTLFDASASGVSDDAGGTYNAFPPHTYTVDAATGTLVVAVTYPLVANQTRFRLVFTGVGNPLTAGSYAVNAEIQTDLGGPHAGPASRTVTIVEPPGVDLGVASDALAYAREINATSANPWTLTNTSGDLNIVIPLSYGFSAGEVRYARVECTEGMQFAANTGVTDFGSASVGAVNGALTSAVYFSVTAPAGGLARTDTISISGDRIIRSTSDVSCTYGLYDYPSQASAGGTTGRIASVTGPYLVFKKSYDLTVTAASATANVEASPSFTKFVAAGETTDATAVLAEVKYDRVATPPRKPNGAAILLTDLMAAGTTLVVTGDFSAAANADGTFTGTALDRVFISGNNTACTLTGAIKPAALTATQATFNVGATAVVDKNLCFTANGAVPAATYKATLNAVAASTAFTVSNVGPKAAGEINRNGTELQAPLAQVPGGWISRLVLTNTGSTARAYTIAVTGETGNTIGTANLTGTVPANGTRVVELKDVMTSFSTGKAPRGTLNVTIEGPSNQIQGLYQIVNPTSGSLSNHVLVRPNTN